MGPWKNVLIADDDELMRFQWKMIVKRSGGTIAYMSARISDVMGNPSIDFSSIDTAIVDYEFIGEEKTGIDLIAYLKGKGVENIYMCTGYAYDPEIVARAKQAGAARVIPKPIDEDSL